MSTKTLALVALPVLALSAGCEIKRGDDDAVEAVASPTPTPSQTLALAEGPEGEASEPASIIRPDVSPSPVIDVPPDPLAATIPFGEGGYELGSKAEKLLAGILKSDQLKEDWPIVLRGHTDSEGDDRGNLFASRKRAEAVAGWLVDNGIAEKRIEVIAIGEQNPVAPNANLDGTPNEEGRRKNRRVEVWIGPPGSQPGKEMPDDSDEKTAGVDDDDA